MKYILAIDQSTSSSKVLLFDQTGSIIASKFISHEQIHPKPGWLEHDPEEIYKNVIIAARSVIQDSGVNEIDILCISITNQRETVVVWDAITGRPIYSAIVWQCSRATNLIQRPDIIGSTQKVLEKTGLQLSPYFSAAKASWILENVDTEGMDLCFGTMDSWLAYKLTGTHVTDYSNASRTQLFNIHTLCWDQELISLFRLESVRFPQVVCADTVIGTTLMEGLFSRPVPVAGIMGDSHGALFGQCCFEPGMGKATFGTGTSVVVNIGKKPIVSANGLSTSIAWGIGNNVEYVLEGNINASGDTIKWLVDTLGILDTVEQAEEYAVKVPDNEGVYLVPAFTGMGAPYWDSDVRACICGLFRNAGKEHIARAGLESISYQIADILKAMNADFGKPVTRLLVDGGATRNALLMQFTADVTRTIIEKKNIEELSAFGSAFAAGIAIGLWQQPSDMENLLKTECQYQPIMLLENACNYYEGWKTAVRKARLQ